MRFQVTQDIAERIAHCSQDARYNDGQHVRDAVRYVLEDSRRTEAEEP